MDSLTLQFSNTNLTLQETLSNHYHHFHFYLMGNSTNFSYIIRSTDPVISNRSGTVAVPSTDHFQFAAYGDSRTQYDVHRNICTAMNNHNPSFVIHTGDLVSDGTDPQEWPLFFNSGISILSNTIFIPANGNHDRQSDMLTNLFDPPLAGLYYYSCVFPFVRIIVLDTDSSFAAGTAQYTWFTNELRLAASKWKIVVFHDAPYSSTEHANDANKPDLQNILVPALIKYNVNLVLNGHDHIYERSTNSNVVFLTTGGGGGPLHTAIYNNVYRAKMVANEHHFVLIDMSSNIMDIRVMNSNSVILDTFSITNTN